MSQTILFVSTIVFINLLSYIFQIATVGYEKNTTLKSELISFILFIPFGIYFVNIGAAEYTKLNRSESNTESEAAQQLSKAIDQLSDLEGDN